MSGPQEIALTDGDVLTDRSAEVARIWITDGEGSSVWIAAYLLEDPYNFGQLVGETIRHAARAYAGTWNLDEGAALQAIVDGTFADLRDQVADIQTIQEGKLD